MNFAALLVMQRNVFVSSAKTHICRLVTIESSNMARQRHTILMKKRGVDEIISSMSTKTTLLFPQIQFLLSSDLPFLLPSSCS